MSYGQIEGYKWPKRTLSAFIACLIKQTNCQIYQILY